MTSISTCQGTEWTKPEWVVGQLVIDALFWNLIKLLITIAFHSFNKIFQILPFIHFFFLLQLSQHGNLEAHFCCKLNF